MLKQLFLPVCAAAFIFTAFDAGAQAADRILVENTARRMTLFDGGGALKSYRIALGFEPDGAKRQQGDGRTPEGIYRISGRKARSRFHRALLISYPNARDSEQARLRGVSPGGNIEIHGLPKWMHYVGSAHALMNWTDGCIGVTNQEIEEIWNLVPDGALVEIKP